MAINYNWKYSNNCTTSVGNGWVYSPTTQVLIKMDNGTTDDVSWHQVPYPTCQPYQYDPEQATQLLDHIPAGDKSWKLPDGSKLVMDDAGNYQIEDKDAKVTYKANRVREFSPHLNASDLVAKFVEYVGRLGVTQRQVLGLPLELFINWLIIEAAERDGDQIPEQVERLEHRREIKLLQDGRHIPKLCADVLFAERDLCFNIS